jgi:hypothetical protein
MRIWPYVLDLSVGKPGAQKPVHVWLPLFLLWPLLAVIALLAFVVTAIADVTLLVVGRPYHRYTVLVYRCLALFADTRGMVVRVNDSNTNVDITLY